MLYSTDKKIRHTQKPLYTKYGASCRPCAIFWLSRLTILIIAFKNSFTISFSLPLFSYLLQSPPLSPFDVHLLLKCSLFLPQLNKAACVGFLALNIIGRYCVWAQVCYLMAGHDSIHTQLIARYSWKGQNPNVWLRVEM